MIRIALNSFLKFSVKIQSHLLRGNSFLLSVVFCVFMFLGYIYYACNLENCIKWFIGFFSFNF